MQRIARYEPIDATLITNQLADVRGSILSRSRTSRSSWSRVSPNLAQTVQSPPFFVAPRSQLWTHGLRVLTS